MNRKLHWASRRLAFSLGLLWALSPAAHADFIFREATASQIRQIGPFVDTDGAPVTGLTIDAADVRISVNGGNIVAKNTGACTHDELGMYACTFNATDTATVGQIQIMVVETGALPVFHEGWIYETVIYDEHFDSGAVGPLLANVNGSTLTEAGGTGDHLTAVAWNAAWDAQVESEVDDALGGGVGTSLTGIPYNAAWDADIQSEVADALTAYDPPTNTELNTAIGLVQSMIGQRWTITVTDQNTIVLADGPATDDTFNPWALMLIDSSDAGGTDLVRVADYTGSSKTVELARNAAFTIVTGDIAVMLPAFANTPVDTAFVNCTVNTANFAGSTTTLACLLTDREGAAVTAASGDLTGRELLITSGAQVYEARFIQSTTWDAGNSELQLTLSRALPGTLADAVTAIIR